MRIDIEVSFTKNRYKSFLNKLKTFISYCATIGIHQSEGTKKVYRRYTKRSKNNKSVGRISGKTHRMTLAKIAYQNEFGADIPIKPTYKTVSKKTKTTHHAYKARITETTISKYSALRNAREQGYLLLSKTGKFVAYFKPNSVIHIPKRPFLTNIVKETDAKLQNNITKVLERTFVKNGYTAHDSIKIIAKIIANKVKENVRKSKPKNHDLTVKAKGFNSPLRDDSDRIYKAIKYKIYRGVKFPSQGQKAFRKQTIKHIDKLLRSADIFDNNGLISSKTSITNIFEYKNSNPNFNF